MVAAATEHAQVPTRSVMASARYCEEARALSSATCSSPTRADQVVKAAHSPKSRGEVSVELLECVRCLGRGDLAAHVHVLCEGRLGMSELVGDGTRRQPCVVQEVGGGLAKDVTGAPGKPAPRQGVSEVGLGVGRVPQPSFECGEDRSVEHTSELQSRQYLVCRLLL